MYRYKWCSECSSEGENYFQFFFSILDICEIFEIIIRYLY